MKELEIFLIKVKDIIAYTYSVEYNKQVRPYFPARKYPFEYKMLEYILKYTKNILSFALGSAITKEIHWKKS